MSELRLALAHVRECEHACDELENRLSEFRSRNTTAKGRLDGAKRAFEAASAKNVLGELSDEELLPLRRAFEQADTEAAGLPGAISALERRLFEAETTHEKAEQAVLAAVRPLAAEYAENHRQRVLELVDELGRSMNLWHRLENLSRGNHSFVTGEHQVERLGDVVAILGKHRVWTHHRREPLLVRHEDEREQELTIAEFIETMGLGWEGSNVS